MPIEDAPKAPEQLLAKDRAKSLEHVTFFAEGASRFGPWTALREYGQFFPPARELPNWLTRGRMGECYANSARAVLAQAGTDGPHYFYVEGYALDPELGIPFDHAWIVDADGNAFDVTWPTFHKATYFGVRFDTRYLRYSMEKTRLFGLLWNLELQRELFASPKAFRNAVPRNADEMHSKHLLVDLIGQRPAGLAQQGSALRRGAAMTTTTAWRR